MHSRHGTMETGCFESQLLSLKIPLLRPQIHLPQIMVDTIFHWSVHRCVPSEPGCFSDPPNIPSCVLRSQSLSRARVLVKTRQVFSGPPKSLTEWSMCVTCHLIQPHATHCISKCTKNIWNTKRYQIQPHATAPLPPSVFPKKMKQKISEPQKRSLSLP